MRRHQVFGVALLAVVVFAAWSAGTPVQAQTAAWLNSPPSAAGSTASCPNASQWLLLYWGGAPIAIANAASTCPGADFYWNRQGDKWLGFASAAPAASDSWSPQTGEATFVHGLTAAAPVAPSGNTAASGTTVPATATATGTAVPTATGTTAASATGTPAPTETATATSTPAATATPPTNPVIQQFPFVTPGQQGQQFGALFGPTAEPPGTGSNNNTVSPFGALVPFQ